MKKAETHVQIATLLWKKHQKKKIFLDHLIEAKLKKKKKKGF